MTMRYLILMFRYMYRLINTVVVKSLQYNKYTVAVSVTGNVAYQVL
jgi:hypothetical protein